MKKNIYNHKAVEKKWQKEWAKKKIYKTSDNLKKDKFYVLDMFPYPSGEGLHVGHPKGYIATDVLSRFKRMNGFNVLHPMGWDAFGLPAENYAIKNKIHPRKAVEKNIKRFKEQLSIIGLDYDWSREINTTDPKYYKWTQWIFLQMLKKGLAYQSFEPINWCPSCKTGLANEDLENGKCERCGSEVEKKPMRQWVLKITDYADRLLKDLDGLDWPESIKESQRNWIGRSEGVNFKEKIKDLNIEFKVYDSIPQTFLAQTFTVIAPEHPLVKKLVKGTKYEKPVTEFVENIKKKKLAGRFDIDKDLEGIFTGRYVENPFGTGDLPIWVASYVLADYGTGIVNCSAHDERDYYFAKKFGIPLKEVMFPYLENKKFPIRKDLPIPKIPRKHVDCILRNPKTDEYAVLQWNEKFGWTTLIGGGIENGESLAEAGKRELREETGYKNFKFIKECGKCFGGGFAAHKNENRVSEIFCAVFDLVNEEKEEITEEEKEKHHVVWLKKDQIDNFLNVESSKYLWNRYLGNFVPARKFGIITEPKGFEGREWNEVREDIINYIVNKGYGERAVNYKLRDWVFSRQRYWGEPIPVIHCEKCGVVPVPEKDLPVKLPEVKSYEPTGTGESPLANISKWVNVKCPVCKGPAKRETNTMPQWAGSSWYYLRYEDPKNSKVIVDNKKEKYWSPVDMYVGGAEHATRHLIYARFWHKFLHDIGIVNYAEPFKQLKNQGLIMGNDGKKMSKRFGNVVNPDDVVKIYGADTLRVYEMFMGPFENSINWSTDNMIGSRRFLERVWRLREKAILQASFPQKRGSSEGSEKNIKLSEVTESLLNKTIKKVTEDISGFSFNTAISSLMILVNQLEKESSLSKKDFERVLLLIAPFAPHMSEDLWRSLGNKKSIHLENWPSFDSSKISGGKVSVVVQINGKVRETLKFDSPEVSQSEALESAKQSVLVAKWIEGKEIKKVIYIKNRLLNLVV